MTVAQSTRQSGPWTATEGQTVFNYDFPVKAASELKVVRLRDNADETLELDVDYGVTQVGADAGTIILTSGAIDGDVITIIGDLPIARTSNFAGWRSIPDNAINDELDRMTKSLQEMKRNVDAAIHTAQAGTAYDFNGSRGINIADGINPQDVATMHQLAAINPAAFAPDLPTIGAVDTENDLLNIYDASTGQPTKITAKAFAAAIIGDDDVEVFKGVIDCSSNPNYPAADAGHVYRVSVAGKVGGASGIVVEVGDRLECSVDNSVAGDQSAVGANWGITQANIDGAVIGPVSAMSGSIARYDGTTGKLIKDSGLAIDDEVIGTPGTVAVRAIGSSSKISLNISAKGSRTPVTIGSNLYPTPYNDFQRYDADSIFVANSIGCRNIAVGFASAIGAGINSWCNNLEPGTDVALQNSVYAISPVGRGAGVFAARSSDLPSPGEATCTQLIVFSDNAVGACTHQGLIVSGYVDAAVNSGFRHTNSISYVANSYALSVKADPFDPVPQGSVYVQQFGSGNGGFVASPTNATAALGIFNNTGKFNSGIIFANNALDTSVNANPDAIALPPAYAISWYNAANAKTWQMYSGAGADGNLKVVTTGNGSLLVQAASPKLVMNSSGAATDNKWWDFIVVGAQYIGRVVNDDQSNATNWLAVTRSGISITDISMPLLNLSVGPLKVAGTQVVNTRRTGWVVATGTASRATFATSSVTLPTLAGVVMALQQDLIAHGLIGA